MPLYTSDKKLIPGMENILLPVTVTRSNAMSCSDFLKKISSNRYRACDELHSEVVSSVIEAYSGTIRIGELNRAVDKLRSNYEKDFLFSMDRLYS